MSQLLPNLLGRVEIRTSPHLKGPYQFRFPRPARLKRYKQRTLKRWRNNLANWRNDHEVVSVRDVLYCHPSTYAFLKAQLIAAEIEVR